MDISSKILKSASWNRLLFSPIDNAQLVVFRIMFGILLTWHCVESLATGWVRRNFILPRFTFSHIGMDWLQPLPGNGMYYYFAAMAVLGIFIAIGYFYRWSLLLFTILWAGVYFMQKTVYNNHYYLLLLVCIIMLFLPANASHSVDSRQNPGLRSSSMPAWCSGIMVLQVGLVYFFAAIAKLYPGWLDGSFTAHMIGDKLPLLDDLYGQKWFYLFIAYSGFLFDLLIVPLLLWKKTRNWALAASLCFHLFNKLHLSIGIFPFFSLSFILFFYPPQTIRRLFLRERNPIAIPAVANWSGKKILLYFFIPFFIFQLLMPLRHWAIKGDVLWTEEGHRLSWRMMLRVRDGYTKFIVIDSATGERQRFRLKKFLTKKQIKEMQTKPDMIWQTAQKIAEKYRRKGKIVAVYADTKVSINHSPLRRLIDPNVDLAKAKWNYFTHNEWIILYE